MSVNRATLIGRLGSDPEMRYTQSGAAVCNFSLATNEKWTDKSGQKQEKTEWHKIIVWGKLADSCAAFLRKGSLAYIEGKIQTRQWQDKNGATQHTTEIQAVSVQFLDSQQRGGSSGDRSEPAPRGAPPSGDDDAEVPF